MYLTDWLSNNIIEIFGAVTGILYVFLEIKQNTWLWPIGIITSAVYIFVFLTGKLYADMSLQVYYLGVSFLGWYWWLKGPGRKPVVLTKERASVVQGIGQNTGSTEIRSQDPGSPFEGGRGDVLIEQEIRSQDPGSPFEGGRGDVLIEQEISVQEIKGLKVTRIGLKTAIILSVVFSILFIIIWLVLSRLTDSPVPACDSFITSLSIVATWMLARKIYEHWYLWIVVNITASILFFTRGLYPTVILYIVYCAMSFAGLKEWGKSLNKNYQ